MTETNLVDKMDWKKMGGLIPVIVQDAKTKEVLMLAYANREALEHTLKTGRGTYWSRSRNELWVKGETSGHIQKIQRVVADCDYDTLLYVVEQTGPACHTGDYTCFHNEFQR
jgi:phosphoribosyl-AMP cyclohydrolase